MENVGKPAFTPYRMGIEWKIPLGDDSHLRFIFEDFTRGPFGPRVTATIAQADVILEKDQINPEKREERVRLSNAAYPLLINLPDGHLAKEEMAHYFMLACADIERAWFDRRLERTEEVPVAVAATKYLVAPYVLEGAGTILFGQPGQGKSFMGLAIAASVQYETTLFDTTGWGNVLFINLERSKSSLEARWLNLARSVGLPPDAIIPMIHARGVPLAQIRSYVEAEIRRRNIDLVVIDSLSRIGGAGSMVDDAVANTAVDMLNSFGCGWLTIGHTPRADSSHVFGSQMFDAAADLCVQLESQAHAYDPNRLTVRLSVTKANDTGKPPPQFYSYHFGEHGLEALYRSDSSQWMTTATDLYGAA